MRLLRELGSAVDANTVWEVEVARKAGFQPSEIVFTGVGKSPAELECAVGLGVKAINVESAGELARVEAIASRLGRTARVAVRVNPDIDAKSHPHISTGLKINKFGVPLDDARALLASLRSRPSLQLVALHVHVGSQITSLDPLRRAAALAARISRELQQDGAGLEYVDLGGGLGVSYDGARGARPPRLRVGAARRGAADGLADRARAGTRDRGTGRRAPGARGRPQAADRRHRLRDHRRRHDGAAAAGALRRVSSHRAGRRPGPTRDRAYEIVGPVCESSDVVGRDRTLAGLQVGDLVAIRDAGAYGSVMASNYNRRPLPAEVLVDGAGGLAHVDPPPVRRVDDMLLLNDES